MINKLKTYEPFGHNIEGSVWTIPCRRIHVTSGLMFLYFFCILVRPCTDVRTDFRHDICFILFIVLDVSLLPIYYFYVTYFYLTCYYVLVLFQLPGSTIIDKVFEINTSFHMKLGTTGKIQFLFFRIVFARIKKSKLILGRRPSTRL